MIFQFLCFIFTRHFIRRDAWVNRDSVPSWRVRLYCWCGRYDIVVSGMCSQEEAQRRAKDAVTLTGWGA